MHSDQMRKYGISESIIQALIIGCNAPTSHSPHRTIGNVSTCISLYVKHCRHNSNNNITIISPYFIELLQNNDYNI